MLRRFCCLAIIPFVLSLPGCGSGDLPSVPPPPPEGTVGPAPPAGVVPPEAIPKGRKAAKLKEVPGAN